MLALIPTVVSLVLMTVAVHAIGSTPTAVMGALEPLTAVVIGVTIFGELFTARLAAGIGLSVVVGVVVYKYVAKPVIANIKAQIEQRKMAAEEKTVILEESDVVTEDN